MNLSINFIKKDHLNKKENIFFLLIIFLIFSCDRVSKIEIINNLNERSYYINDYINFDLIWNTGVGFGLLSSKSELIYNLLSLFIALVISFLIHISLTSDNIDKIAFSFICGGALGNFYDRIVYKAVPDFIDLHLENFHWFTFNLADIFITIGILIFLMKGTLIKT